MPEHREGRRGSRYVEHAYRERNIILLIVAVILVIGAIFGIRATGNARHALQNSYQSAGFKKARDTKSLIKERKPFSILLLGTDTGELGRTYKGRTDSLMLAVVNPKDKTTTLVSLPRDTIVAPIGYENQFPAKLNSAYEFGSAKTTMQTVQAWLNVPVDYYALVNMRGLEQVVNEIGGIKVTSPLTFKYNPDTAHEDPGNLYAFKQGSSDFTHTGKDNVKKTYHEMDGKAALAFSRMRYQDPEGDYGRQARQRLVLEALAKKVKSNPLKLANPDFLEAMSKSIKTDLKFNDMENIGGNYIAAAGNIKTGHLTGVTYNTSAGSAEYISNDVKQPITNRLRKELGLSPAKTGPVYAGNVNYEQTDKEELPTP
ncbi:LCP family protein required for cell wall assembly [Weissella uvarum]|uniref:LCP family protein n=1 Tax=Weissella uvarum TaxID=1479233 RepID=UPI001960E6E5|nr:LCP family protein [Weissella uvarum]MBM7618035.1 LCP family protein required for cell wall assembly [Weissella uvarum]MCM0595108.1 LCP family protein [Weissella uvarum]